ncbi:unnamed protein product [Caenorhabditis auriculariae]|uniref:Uncharacterized protein n=1 Tax=Caenorhabditis auriculariae TaxID=2777116 RepID=A0A8S1GT53_9PELO|nr:unnamed protein product [Caenorhabditis auriculariae]
MLSSWWEEPSIGCLAVLMQRMYRKFGDVEFRSYESALADAAPREWNCVANGRIMWHLFGVSNSYLWETNLMTPTNTKAPFMCRPAKPVLAVRCFNIDDIARNAYLLLYPNKERLLKDFVLEYQQKVKETWTMHHTRIIYEYARGKDCFQVFRPVGRVTVATKSAMTVTLRPMRID